MALSERTVCCPENTEYTVSWYCWWLLRPLGTLIALREGVSREGEAVWNVTSRTLQSGVPGLAAIDGSWQTGWPD